MSYDVTLLKDLVTTTPVEGSTLPSELNDAIREIKTVLKPLWAVSTKAASASLTNLECNVICSGQTEAITLTLPTVSGCSSSTFAKTYHIRNYGSFAVTVDGYADETIDGAANVVLRPTQGCILIGDGTSWYTVRPQPKFRGARVTNSADLAIGYTATTLTWDTESYDTDSIHSTVTNTERLTVPSGVSYVRIKGHVQIRDDETTDMTTLTLLKNDATIQTATIISDTDYVSSAGYTLEMDSGVIAVSAGDYFHLTVSGVTNNTESDYSWFAMEIVE